MLHSIAEQKMVLAAYSTEGDIPTLTPYQLDLIGKLIAVLNPTEEMTKSISTDAASVSLLSSPSLEPSEGLSRFMTMIVEYEQ